MGAVNTITDVIAVLENLIPTGRVVYNQDNIRKIMKFLGDPQNKLKIVHVAGTSGKTSTSYYIAAMLQATGKKVGLTVSPHIDSVTERVQLNGQPLSDQQFTDYFRTFFPLLKKSGVQPSYFECLIAFAYWVFAKEKVDYAVIEVGLGGRKDATNVVEREDKICVITDIGYDHTEILGDTLEKIAYEKGGIIQEGNQVFMYEQEAPVMTTIDDIVAEKRAILHVIQKTDKDRIPDHLPLFQRRNWLLAMVVVHTILGKHLTSQQREDSSRVVVPARMEIIELKNGKTIILDGSHNGQKMQTLAVSLASRFPDQKFGILAGFAEVPNPRAFDALEELLPLVGRIIFTEFSGKQDGLRRGINPDILSDYVKTRQPLEPETVRDPAAAYKALLVGSEKLLLVTGSFYLLNHIRPLVLNKKQDLRT